MREKTLELEDQYTTKTLSCKVGQASLTQQKSESLRYLENPTLFAPNKAILTDGSDVLLIAYEDQRTTTRNMPGTKTQ